MSHNLQRPTLSHEVLERFRSLVCIPAPSSREHQIAATICEQLQAMGLQPERDAGGNVMVEVPGRDPELPLWCYAAHMDEISMVVTRIRSFAKDIDTRPELEEILGESEGGGDRAPAG